MKDGATGSQKLSGGKWMTVLVVDDEQVVVTACLDILEFYGFDVIAANNGADAVMRILQSKSTVDLVVTDLMMPSMDGLAAAG